MITNERIEGALLIFGLVDESARGALEFQVRQLLKEERELIVTELRKRAAQAKGSVGWGYLQDAAQFISDEA